MRPADLPAIERLYERACPGQTANLGTEANRLSFVIERDERIVAAVLGNFALVSLALLLADPDAADSENAHDSIVALRPLLSAVREASEPGAIVGQLIVVPNSLHPLGEAMERAGLRSQLKNAAAYVVWDLNVPDDVPIATA
jgi:hypothetical protein